jgi:hypothetical protein
MAITYTIMPKPKARKLAAVAGCVMVVLLLSAAEEPSVRVEPVDPSSPREVEPQTQQAVVRDYLLAWQTLNDAMQANQPDLLDSAFLGVAREKLANTVEDQQKLGITTRYIDRSHDLKVVFYSPEGLSIQLLDTVEYDVQLLKDNNIQATQHVRARYVAVLSPTEVRWKVRILQSVAQ